MPNARWLWFDFTDARFKLTSEQKREIRQRARRIGFFDRPVFTLGTPPTNGVRKTMLRRRSAWSRFAHRMPMAMVYVAWLAFALSLPYALLHGPLLLVVGMVVFGGGLLWIGTCWIGSILVRPWYRYAMYELGYEICAACGYPLIGLGDSPHCPECGWRKTHRDDPPAVQWTDDDRKVLRAHGYESCDTCGGLLQSSDRDCPRCGENRHDAALDAPLR